VSSLPDTLRVGCKLNLNLLLTGVRPNGWHDLDSLFFPLPEPFDELVLRPGKGEGLRLRCATPGIDCADNTLTKAYQSFASASGFAPALDVDLIKGIPHGMGLGGGSADAAGLLLWLNAAAPQPLGETELAALALGVGADVPFFLQNRPCIATGLGEVLKPAKVALGGWLVLVCPAASVSTPWAYKAYDAAMREKDGRLFLTGSGAQAIRLASIGAGMPRHAVMINDFEPMVLARHALVRRCKEHLLEAGASAAAMSGSGAAVFGVFKKRMDAERALRTAEPGTMIGAWLHMLG